MSAHDNIQTTKGVYAAFKRGDRAAMLAVFAENIRLVSEPGAGELPWAGVYEGHAGVETQQDRLAEQSAAWKSWISWCQRVRWLWCSGWT